MMIPGSLADLNLSEPIGVTSLGAEEVQPYLQFYGFTKLVTHGSLHHFGGLNLAGYRIATHVWRQPNASANILLVPGLFDHVGLYMDVIQTLLSANFTVVAIDLPGHGLSSGPVAAIHDFDEYGQLITECLAVLDSVLTSPWYGLAQSTGCAALMNYMFLAQQNGRPIRFKKVAFFAPLVKPTYYRVVHLAYILLSPFLKQVKRSFKRNSHDQEFFNFLVKKDPLQSRYISVPWVAAMITWVKNFSHQPTIQTPLFIVQGTNDQTVDYRFNLPEIQKKFTHTEVHYVQNAMHHLARESAPYRDEALAKVLDFLND